MKLFLYCATRDQDRMSNSINGALGVGASDSAARLAVLAAKPNGEFDAAKFAGWSSYELVDGVVTLPGGVSAIFTGRVHGGGVSPMPGA